MLRWAVDAQDVFADWSEKPETSVAIHISEGGAEKRGSTVMNISNRRTVFEEFSVRVRWAATKVD
jgi:hypothetical protein